MNAVSVFTLMETGCAGFQDGILPFRCILSKSRPG
jgi:hypothetical protein